MLNPKRLFGYLATGVMPEVTALDESLAEHDKKYHPKGYDPATDRCGRRDSQNDLDISDYVRQDPRSTVSEGALDEAYRKMVENGDMEGCAALVARVASRNMTDAVRDEGGCAKRIRIGDLGLSPENSPWSVNSMPDELAEYIARWDIVSKSPYSDSFYNASGITWSHKPDRSIRVADHWNFSNGGEIHCVTDKPVEDVRTWAVAEYHKEDGKYHVLKTFKANGAYVPSDGFSFARMDAPRKRQADAVYQGLRDASMIGYFGAIRQLKGKKVKWRGLPNSHATCMGFIGNKASLKTASGKTIEVNAVELAKENSGDVMKPAVFIDAKTGRVKSAAPVTYDDDGNVIPLSKRFQMDNNDIRY